MNPTDRSSTRSDSLYANDSVKVRFLRPPEGIKITEQMKAAFDLSSDEDVAWISSLDLNAIRGSNNIVYVCQQFSGEDFKKLQNTKCRVIGPNCIIMCHKRGEQVPKRFYPILSMAMSGLSVCCTSIDREYRLELYNKVKLMGGNIVKELTLAVTHLVCGEVGSKKYHVACNQKKHVMLPTWVEECWNRSHTDCIHATDPEFIQFSCPVFYGYNITASQVSTTQRNTLQKLITENGGKYSGILRVDVTTHLVLNEATGEKYTLAKKKGIPCIKVDWIRDSVHKKYCLDENLYILDGPKENFASTPTKNQVPLNCSTLSSIGDNSTCKIDETCAPNSTFIPDLTKEGSSRKQNLDSYLSGFDNLQLVGAGHFLDGCKILLSGFEGTALEKMRRLINAGGATRFSHLNDSVSHVVVGKKIDPGHKKLLQEHYSPHVVNVDWVIESHKLGSPADESLFRCYDFSFDTTAVLLQTKASLNSTLRNESDDKTIIAAEPLDNEVVDIIAQYKDNNAENKGPEIIESNKMFSGKTFSTCGFDHCDVINLKEMVEACGGIFYEFPKDIVVDYAIIPIPACKITLKSTNVVTDYWLQRCIEDQFIYDIEKQPLFSALNIDVKAKPLDGCVICFTQYSGFEKDCLVRVAVSLGAKCQDYFSRQYVVNKGLVPNTHLIALKADGSKYKAAMSWRVPVVSSSWLVECALKGIKVAESLHFLGDASFLVKPTEGVVENVLDVVTLQDGKAGDASPSLAVGVDQNGSIFKSPFNPVMPSTANKLQLRNVSPLQNNRVKDLIKTELSHSNSTSSCESPGPSSPSKIMSADVNFVPKLNIREAMAALQTPSPNPRRTCASKLSFQESYDLNVRKALRNEIKNHGGIVPRPSLNCSLMEENPVDENPLSGVTIVVSKKLAYVQSELNGIAEKLGAKYRWMYDKHCTHFIHQGKVNDSNKELKQAKDDNKFIVSPEWLRNCFEQKTRVKESLYPCTYNPNMALTIVTQKENSVLKSDQDSKSSRKDLFKSSSVSGNGLGFEKSSILQLTAENEMKETANRKIDEILEATKAAKNRRENSRNRTKNSISLNNSFNSSLDGKNFSKHWSSRKEPSSASSDNGSEPLESLPITWDDPTSRLEYEKLAPHLQDDNNDYQNLDSLPCAQQQMSNADSDVEMNKKVAKSYVFMFTGMKPEEREKAANIVKNLGGDVIESQHYNKKCSHLVISVPSRSEKFLASIAAGIWVLHLSYLDACASYGCFIDEEDFEWANSNLQGNLNPDICKVVSCARHWRLEISQMKVSNPMGNPGAFQGWRVIIYTNGQRAESFKRLLEAGGATVLSDEAPFSKTENASHAFVELDKVNKPNIDLAALVAAGVFCLKPDYICTYLSDMNDASLEPFFIPEILPLLKSTGKFESFLTKRKSDDSNLDSKRTKQQ